MRLAVAGGTGVIGRQVVAAAERRGHEVVVLSRAKGVDLTSSSDLAHHLTGVDAVIDVTSTGTMSERKAVEFFRTVTDNLLAAETRVGTRHHVALSIIGVPEIDAGYYAGKRVQEDLVLADTRGSVVRAAQFHDFGLQTVDRTRVGPLSVVPTMRSQPVSTTEVADLLLEVAEGDPVGLGPSIAGPEVMTVAEMSRRVLTVRHDRTRVIAVPLPGAFGRGLRGDLLLARPDSRIGDIRYAQWLETEQA